MKIHQLSIDEALTSVRSSSGGLSSSEAERRRREFGPNRVEKVAAEPAVWRLLKEFTRFSVSYTHLTLPTNREV